MLGRFCIYSERDNFLLLGKQMELKDIFSRTLVIIPARKGSEGLPGKNTRVLIDKPLFRYAVDLALSLFPAESICLTTDDPEILAAGKKLGLERMLERPAELAQSETAMAEVIQHCLNQHPGYKYGLLLQPTSPLRAKKHILESGELLDENTEGVFSVSRSEAVPAYTLLPLDSEGLLQTRMSVEVRRQDAEPWFMLNGAIYWFHIASFLQTGNLMQMSKVRPYLMDRVSGLDIDTEEDWQLAEYFISRRDNDENVKDISNKF